MTETAPSQPTSPPGDSSELTRGQRLGIMSLVFAILGMCLWPFAVAAIIEGVRALSKGRTRSGSSGQVMAIIALCLAPVSAVAGLGTCTAVAIPAFVKYLRRSKVAEAEENIATIYDGVVAFHARTGRLPDSLPLTPAEPPSADRRLWPAAAPAGWSALGFAPADPIYFGYALEVSADRRSFAVRARGDLDGDGTQSLFERQGVVEGGTIRGQEGLFVEYETE